ncbi:hypothetical protein NN561_006627 [Cricetulus griseus]
MSTEGDGAKEEVLARSLNPSRSRSTAELQAGLFFGPLLHFRGRCPALHLQAICSRHFWFSPPAFGKPPQFVLLASQDMFISQQPWTEIQR